MWHVAPERFAPEIVPFPSQSPQGRSRDLVLAAQVAAQQPRSSLARRIQKDLISTPIPPLTKARMAEPLSRTLPPLPQTRNDPPIRAHKIVHESSMILSEIQETRSSRTQRSAVFFQNGFVIPDFPRSILPKVFVWTIRTTSVFSKKINFEW